MSTIYILILGLCTICCGTGQKENKIHKSVAGTAAVLETPILPGAIKLEEYLPLLSEKKVGIICNRASVIGRVHLVDTLKARGMDIQYIFAPEHGFRANADAGAPVDDSIDPSTGIRIVSLYGKRKEFPEIYLDSLDMLVFDLQDVGVRFFTYINNLYYAMDACARKGVPLLILDRPNPNGYFVDGPLLEEGFESGVGLLKIPVVYGLTIGELAGMINGEGWLENGRLADIRVVTCPGYSHELTYDLPVKPSPNLPNLRSILLYPSLCFFEGTTLSIGRGTNTQFQVIGHPHLEGEPHSFVPHAMPGASNPKHLEVVCHGISQEHLEIREIMNWRRINLGFLLEFYHKLKEDDPFFLENNFFDLLAGTDQLRKDIRAGFSEEEIRGRWEGDLASFKEKRKEYLLYDDFE